MHRFQIPVPNIFSYELTLTFLLRNTRELLHLVENRKIWKTLLVNDSPILFTIEELDGALDVTVLNRTITRTEAQHLEKYVSKWFDLDTNLEPYYQKYENDKLLGPLIRKFHGYRIVGQPDLFESLIWAVLGQQINLSFAYTLKQRFVEEYGKTVEWEGRKYYMFPTASDVTNLNPESLLPLQFSRQKANYTVEIAKAFTDGTIDADYLQRLPLTQAKEKLMQIKGVGNWTANYALMKTFQFPDAFPLEDAGLHNALKIQLGLREKPSREKILKLFKKYAGWEGYATLYLWKSL